MSDTNHEKLLWKLADCFADSDEPPATDEVLIAYRRGELRGEQRRQIEQHLTRSRSARAQLIALAQAKLDAPPPALREQVLQQAPRARRRWSRWSIAASIAAVLLLSVSILINRPGNLPEHLEYQVAASGLADTRDAVTSGTAVDAYPQTEIHLTVTPREMAVAEVEIGLYQERGTCLERARPGAQLQLQEERGVAIMSARAADLVGTVPGTYRLWVVAAVTGDLPDRLQVAAGESPRQVLMDGSRRRAYQLTLRLLQPEIPDS